MWQPSLRAFGFTSPTQQFKMIPVQKIYKLDSLKDMEKRISHMVTNALRTQNEAFLRLKNECRQGFTTVHDSITNSKQVLEGKLTLSEEQLRKEIGHVKKMVVLV